MGFVVSKLNGGLGNQLFQYATARALADSRGVDLFLDISAYKSDKKRVYELDKFNIVAEVLDNKNSAGMFAAVGSRDGLLRRMFWSIKSTIRVEEYQEHDFSYDPRLADVALPVRLCGYWQSEKYFSLIESKLRKELIPISSPDEKNEAVAKAISCETSVSVHIRRGDYVSDSRISKVHGICDMDYYRRAVQLLVSKVNNPIFYVFSDDPVWVEQNLDFGHRYNLVTHNQGESAYWDLRLMSMCRHQIIANSSFSWWGAWLNPCNDKIVIAPRHWFRDKRKNTDDLIPPGWLLT